ASAGVTLGTAGRRCGLRVQSIVARNQERSGGPEALFVKYQPMRFQDRTGLPLQGGQRDVIAQELLSLGRDGGSPVGERLQNGQVDTSARAKLLQLYLHVQVRSRPGFFERQVLLVGTIQ